MGLWGVLQSQKATYPGAKKKKKKEPTDYTPSRDFQPNLCLCGVPETLNLSSLDLGSARNPGPTLDSSPAEQPGA